MQNSHLELEGWKLAEQERFKLQLKDMELSTLNVCVPTNAMIHSVCQALKEEWKRRERHRDTIHRKQMDEFAKMEKSLQVCCRFCAASIFPPCAGCNSSGDGARAQGGWR